MTGKWFCELGEKNISFAKNYITPGDGKFLFGRRIEFVEVVIASTTINSKSAFGVSVCEVLDGDVSEDADLSGCNPIELDAVKGYGVGFFRNSASVKLVEVIDVVFGHWWLDVPFPPLFQWYHFTYDGEAYVIAVGGL